MREDAIGAFQLAIEWGRLAEPWASKSSGAGTLLAQAILGHASMLRGQAIETYSGGQADRFCLGAALNLYRTLTDELQAAAELDPVEPKLAEVVQNVLRDARTELLRIESEYNRLAWGAL